MSDIIIYRTRAERLQKDMYTFLGGASEVYKKHFSSALQKALARTDGERLNTGQSSLLLVCKFLKFLFIRIGTWSYNIP